MKGQHYSIKFVSGGEGHAVLKGELYLSKTVSGLEGTAVTKQKSAEATFGRIRQACFR